MSPFGKGGSRTILPPMEADPKDPPGSVAEWPGPVTKWPGLVTEWDWGPPEAAPSQFGAIQSDRPDIPQVPAAGHHADEAPGVMPIAASAHPPSYHLPDSAGTGLDGLHAPAMTPAQDFAFSDPTASGPPMPAHDPARREAAQEQAGPFEEQFGGPAGRETGTVDDVHSIGVTQFAEVDQDARIVVTGYCGEVEGRLHIEQDLMIEQDVGISVSIDAGGHFAVLIDQDMRLEQDTEVDVRIFEVGEVLYVDIFLRDSIEVEQDMTIDMLIGVGPAGGTVKASQDLDIDQDVQVDIEIEDDLDERYAVDLDVEVIQKVDAVQDSDVDITNLNGELDIDADASQMAFVDQELIVRADFVLA